MRNDERTPEQATSTHPASVPPPEGAPSRKSPKRQRAHKGIHDTARESAAGQCSRLLLACDRGRRYANTAPYALLDAATTSWIRTGKHGHGCPTSWW